MKSDDPGRREGGEAPDDEPADEGTIDALVADELVRRGELLPTREAEVLAAERAGVEHEGELPPGLRELAPRASTPAPSAAVHGRRSRAPASEPPRSRREAHEHGAASHRVVGLEEVRRRRAERRSGWASHAGTFVLGAAAAAALLLVTREPRTPVAGDRRPAGVPSAPASATPSAAPADARIAVPPVTTCEGTCCAGARCAAAKGELRRCASGRSCVGCEEGTAVKSPYRLRLGSLVPAKALAGDAVGQIDLCARLAGGAWSCEPARPDGGEGGRVLPGLATAADLAAGLELELRPRGGKQVLGRWQGAVRVGPTVLCQGAGALLASEKADLGSLSIALEPAHWVEIARADATEPLRALRRRLDLADVDPVLVETTAGGDARFALAVGPVDAAIAERLRWALLDRGLDAQVTVGGDHRGAPQKLAAPTPSP